MADEEKWEMLARLQDALLNSAAAPASADESAACCSRVQSGRQRRRESMCAMHGGAAGDERHGDEVRAQHESHAVELPRRAVQVRAQQVQSQPRKSRSQFVRYSWADAR